MSLRPPSFDAIRRTGVKGTGRLERAAGVAGAAFLGLLFSQRFAPRLSVALGASLHFGPASSSVVAEKEELLAQFLSFLLTLAFATLAATAWLALERWRPVARAVRPLRSAIVALALVGAFAVSLRLGLALLLLLPGAASLLVGQVGGGSRPSVPTPATHILAFAFLCEGLATIWGAWLCIWTLEWAGRGVLIGIVTLASSLVFGRLARIAGITDNGRRDAELTRDVVAFSPTLLLPILGLLRAPSPLFCAVALLLAFAVRRLVPERILARIPLGPIAIAAVASLASLIVIPLGMHDLPTSNHQGHEAQHLGWINSALCGKLLGADASMVYGPLREYFLTAFAVVTGVTLDHVRIAHVVLNLIGFVMLLAIGWRVAGKKLWLLVWLAYLLVAHTPLRVLVGYHRFISLGWADIARPAVGLLATWGAVGASVRHGSAANLDRRATGVLLGWGAVAGLALLYSQEFGACAVGATACAVSVECLLAAPGTYVRRAARALHLLGAFFAGALAPLVLTLLVYSAFGRGKLFLHSVFRFAALAASGGYGSITSPVSAASFADPWALAKAWVFGLAHDARYHYADAEFAIPPAVYVLSLVSLIALVIRRRWNDRAALRLALTAFGIASFRIALARADSYHLILATAPAILLVVDLARDAAGYRPRIGTTSLPVGVAFVLVAACFSIYVGEQIEGVRGRVMEMVRGEERPSGRTAHATAGLARAGDAIVPSADADLARFIRSHSEKTDPIFIHEVMMNGADQYFLSKRCNATRFDLLLEIVTTSDQEEVMADLLRHPPAVVVGTDTTYVGDKVAHFLKDNWSEVHKVGGEEVRLRPIGAPPLPSASPPPPANAR